MVDAKAIYYTGDPRCNSISLARLAHSLEGTVATTTRNLQLSRIPQVGSHHVHSHWRFSHGQGFGLGGHNLGIYSKLQVAGRVCYSTPTAASELVLRSELLILLV